MEWISWIALFQPLALTALFYSTRIFFEPINSSLHDTQMHEMEDRISQIIDCNAMKGRLEELEKILEEVQLSLQRLQTEFVQHLKEYKNNHLREHHFPSDSKLHITLAGLAFLQLMITVCLGILLKRQLNFEKNGRLQEAEQNHHLKAQSSD